MYFIRSFHVSYWIKTQMTTTRIFTTVRAFDVINERCGLQKLLTEQSEGPHPKTYLTGDCVDVLAGVESPSRSGIQTSVN